MTRKLGLKIGTGAATWSPSNNPPDIWFKPDSIGDFYQDTGTATPVASDSDVVGHIVDHSGNARDFTEFTLGNKALYRTGTHPYLSFDATDDTYLGNAAVKSLFNANAGATFVFALNLTSDASERYILSVLKPDFNIRIQLEINTSHKAKLFASRADADGLSSITGLTTVDTGSDVIIACRYDPSATFADIYVDTTQDISSSSFGTSGAAFAATTPAQVNLGDGDVGNPMKLYGGFVWGSYLSDTPLLGAIRFAALTYQGRTI